ncbi:MAG: ABC transporter ATP-binding protein [Actinomycetota bacterium]|nr:ABC transporter ATP-binding protein [Actinomycetota bacterium]
MISVEDLSKDFNGVKALDGVCLEIAAGETFGLIGPNGAGKTTLIKILTGQITPTRGEILLERKPVNPGDAAYRLKVGLVPQEPAFYGRLTARENLRLLGLLYGMRKKDVEERVGELLSWVGLEEYVDRQVRFYSRGMQQRLSLSMGLVHRPDLIYLDEPTSGLDPTARSSLWELMARLSEEGRSVFITTHNMDEADHVCDRLAILVKGVVREEGSPAHIKGLLGADQVEVRLARDVAGKLDEISRGMGLTWRAEGDRIIISGPELTDKLAEIVIGLGGDVRGLHYREVTLEDAFLRFMREVAE